MTEATRLERLWSGPFGDAYTERNATLDERRADFWDRLLTAHPIRNVLEVGCGQGGNLAPIARILPPAEVWGVDVNESALARARANAPGVNAVRNVARRLPFGDELFDLVFTMGVLIHQPDSTLPLVMAEIVRCSRRFVFSGEYHAEKPTEVPYHLERGALIKRDYGRLYGELFPELELIEEGFLGPDSGFDRVTYQLFAKPGS